MHPVVLGAPGADNDDRCADSLCAGRFDHAPAVLLGQHEIEDAHVRVLVAEACEPKIALRHEERFETRGAEVLGHRLPDHLVVFDDEDCRHRHVNNGV